MNPLALYSPGDSLLHRLPAGAKLAGLVAAGIASPFLDTPASVGVLAALVVLGYVVARVGWRQPVGQLRPLAFLVLPLFAAHWWLSGLDRAIVVVGVLVALILLAGLVTLTTRTEALVDVVVRCLGPLRRVGVDAERVGLMFALGIRAVPVMLGLAAEIREAQLARGLGASPRAFAVPLVVRSLRHADDLGDALVARGLDD